MIEEDWGGELQDEYSKKGIVEYVMHIDEENTTKLMQAIGGHDGKSLLVRMRAKFGKFGFDIKSEIQRFCKEENIAYYENVYY